MSKTPAVPQSALDAAGAIVTTTSLALRDPDLPWEAYEKLGYFIGDMNQACAWWVGDLVLYGEELYGQEHAQIEQALRLAPQTIANRASVARHIPPSERRVSLDFSTHAEVAYMPRKERNSWLDKADKGAWTRGRLREELIKAGVRERPERDSLSGNSGVPAQSMEESAENTGGARSHTCPACGHEF